MWTTGIFLFYSMRNKIKYNRFWNVETSIYGEPTSVALTGQDNTFTSLLFEAFPPALVTAPLARRAAPKFLLKGAFEVSLVECSSREQFSTSVLILQSEIIDKILHSQPFKQLYANATLQRKLKIDILGMCALVYRKTELHEERDEYEMR